MLLGMHAVSVLQSYTVELQQSYTALLHCKVILLCIYLGSYWSHCCIAFALHHADMSDDAQYA